MKSLLIADSGSTKTEWRLLQEGKVIKAFRSHGINPNVQGFETIEPQIRTEVLPHLIDFSINEVVFYGSGLSIPDYCLRMEEIISVSLNADKVIAHHDLLGAARATSSNEPAIVCILGTGSNSCLYDGEKIDFEIGGNGYLLGDEGSGTDMGKRLLKGFLDDHFQSDLRQKFEEYLGLNIRQIRNNVYSAEKPNVYLASFTKFISQYPHNPILQAIVKSSIRDFLLQTVCKYYEFQDLTVNFVGSIATVFKPTLLSLCKDYVINVGKVIESPIENLVAYHLETQKKLSENQNLILNI